MADKTMPTPGPWVWGVGEDGAGQTVFMVAHHADRFWHALIPLRDAHDDHHEASLNEADANARLIAAAGTAAHECAEMGYDPVEAVKALPARIRRAATPHRIADEFRAIWENRDNRFPDDESCYRRVHALMAELMEWDVATRAAGKEGADQ
jgi:hypothetical protein